MKVIALLAIFLLLIFLGSASVLKVGVKPELRGNISAIFYQAENGVLKLSLEFFNTGSIAYKARARFDVLNSSEILFTAWSKEETLMPGETKNFEMFYYSSKNENLTLRLRVYYANEITEKYVNLTLSNKKKPENIFQVKNFRVYEDYLRFEIKANRSTRVLVIPSNFVPGWIFEQAKVELKENKNTEVILPFSSQVWFSNEILIQIVSEDGNYYYSNSFYLEKERGLLKYVNLLKDKLSVALNL